MYRKVIPDIVRQNTVWHLPPEASARAAAQTMAEHDISAVVVTEDGLLRGILTERDLTRRLVAAGLDADSTPVSTIMTTNPDTLTPDDSAFSARELMQLRRIRHLPVVDGGGHVIAMVSIRDLCATAQAEIEEAIRERTEAMFAPIG